MVKLGIQQKPVLEQERKKIEKEKSPRSEPFLFCLCSRVPSCWNFYEIRFFVSRSIFSFSLRRKTCFPFGLYSRFYWRAVVVSGTKLTYDENVNFRIILHFRIYAIYGCCFKDKIVNFKSSLVDGHVNQECVSNII